MDRRRGSTRSRCTEACTRALVPCGSRRLCLVLPRENFLYSVKAPASPAHRSAPCRACGLAAVPGAGRRVLRSGALTGALLERIWSDSDAPARRAERGVEVLTTSRRP
jgi:hypothetical protein